MKKLFIAILLLIAATGCANDKPDVRVKTMDLNPDPLVVTKFTNLKAPSMNRAILDQDRDQVIKWIKQTDKWMLRVVTAPLNGKMNDRTRKEMRNNLMQVFAPDVADQLIRYFWRFNNGEKVYQAVHTDAMMQGLDTEWEKYELSQKKKQPDLVELTLKGSSSSEGGTTWMKHTSTFQVMNERLIIVGYRTQI